MSERKENQNVAEDSSKQELTNPETPYLVEDYKICSERADRFSGLIWNLTTLLITLSAGGILLIAQIEDFEIYDYWLVVIIVFAVFFILYWYNRVANRWNSYQHAFYIRMKEIEDKTDYFWASRYITIMDKYVKNGENSLNDLEKSKLYLLEERTKNYSAHSIKKSRQQLISGVQIIWVLVLVIKGFEIWKEYDDISIKLTVILVPILFFIASLMPFLCKKICDWK